MIACEGWDVIVMQGSYLLWTRPRLCLYRGHLYVQPQPMTFESSLRYSDHGVPLQTGLCADFEQATASS